MSAPYLEIQETNEGGGVRLGLVGELDLGSVQDVEARLGDLAATGHRVRIDLSGVTFIDSSGIRMLIHALRDASRDGWVLEIDRRVPPQVRRIFDLANVEPLILGDEAGQT